MKKNVSRKEKAAVALTLLTEEYLKSFPKEEQERRIRAFGLKVAELRKKSAKSSKSRAVSPGRRRSLAHG